MTPSAENVRRLLRPRSVAFVGGSLAPNALAECEAAGFDGPIYAVHPTRAEVGGHATYPSVLDLPASPDAAFVAVNAAASIEVVRQLAELGAGGAVLYAAGFSEAGTAEGAALEEALREAAGDLAVLGPNCYGVVDLVEGVSLWPVPYPHKRRDRGVAMVLQSGNLGINVSMSQRSLPLAFLASVGNQAVLDVAQVVEAYLGMDEVTGIGIYLEGLRDVARFARDRGSCPRPRHPHRGLQGRLLRARGRARLHAHGVAGRSRRALRRAVRALRRRALPVDSRAARDAQGAHDARRAPWPARLRLHLLGCGVRARRRRGRREPARAAATQPDRSRGPRRALAGACARLQPPGLRKRALGAGGGARTESSRRRSAIRSTRRCS